MRLVGRATAGCSRDCGLRPARREGLQVGDPSPQNSRIQRPLLGPDAPYQPSHSAAQPLPFPDHPQPRAATQVPSRLTTIRCAISCVMIGTITVGGVPITDESTGDATAK